MTHPCPRCGRETDGAYSEGGLKWAICDDCMRAEREGEECYGRQLTDRVMILTREQTSLLASLHGKGHMPPFEAADVYFIVDAGLAVLRAITDRQGGGRFQWSLTEKGKLVLAENGARHCVSDARFE